MRAVDLEPPDGNDPTFGLEHDEGSYVISDAPRRQTDRRSLQISGMSLEFASLSIVVLVLLTKAR